VQNLKTAFFLLNVAVVKLLLAVFRWHVAVPRGFLRGSGGSGVSVGGFLPTAAYPARSMPAVRDGSIAMGGVIWSPLWGAPCWDAERRAKPKSGTVKDFNKLKPRARVTVAEKVLLSEA